MDNDKPKVVPIQQPRAEPEIPVIDMDALPGFGSRHADLGNTVKIDIDDLPPFGSMPPAEHAVAAPSAAPALELRHYGAVAGSSALLEDYLPLLLANRDTADKGLDTMIEWHEAYARDPVSMRLPPSVRPRNVEVYFNKALQVIERAYPGIIDARIMMRDMAAKLQPEGEDWGSEPIYAPVKQTLEAMRDKVLQDDNPSGTGFRNTDHKRTVLAKLAHFAPAPDVTDVGTDGRISDTDKSRGPKRS